MATKTNSTTDGAIAQEEGKTTLKSMWKGERDIKLEGGRFNRPASTFRSFISSEPSSPFPPEANRYVLYVNYGCPWAHRAIIVRHLKGLQDILQLVEVDAMEWGKGWFFSGNTGPDKDPLYGVKYLRELYEKAQPGYEGRVTVPTLWDKKEETIVNNESSEIIRMLYTEFDSLIPEPLRESSKGKAGLYPEHLRSEIDSMNEWVYNTVNNGVYKCGFASTQEAYDENIYPLFSSMDRLEEHLGQPGHSPFLFGENITEADIRLYTTMARFDVAYHTLFKCNLKMIRYDYPNLHLWLRRLYWDESAKTNGGAFYKTSKADLYKVGYAGTSASKVVPAGPVPPIMSLEATVERTNWV